MSNSPSIIKILRLKDGTLDHLVGQMEKITGKHDVIEEIETDIKDKIVGSLKELGLGRDAYAEDVFKALMGRISGLENRISEITFHPRFDTPEGTRTLVNMLAELMGEQKGFFLKEEKAREFLRKNPPKNIMKALGYSSVKSMLEKEDLWEIFAALRFAEDMEWLNTVFFKPYKNLLPADFEERLVKFHVMHPKWTEIARDYVGHKLHNISHLKELGLIFVIPYEKPLHGQIIQVFTLVLHYFHEIKFYSDLFKQFSLDPDSFATHMISALRGDVGGLPMDGAGAVHWRIVQRYLAKDDANDPRLFEPHVNPEALHWSRGEKDFQRWGKRFEEPFVKFWNGLDYVGDYFSIKDNKPASTRTLAGRSEHASLVSFDLVDNIVSYVRKSNIDFKYLYHQQEALWNEIFMRFSGGEKELEKLLVENFTKAYISLKAR